MTLLQFMHACIALGATFRGNARVANFDTPEDALSGYELIHEAYPKAKLKLYITVVSLPRELNPQIK